MAAPRPLPRLLAALALAAALAACAGQTGMQPETPGVQSDAAIPRGERVITGNPNEPQGPITPEKARTECWMRYEKDKTAKNLDAKIVLVDKCVAEKLKTQ
jgi:hypothetical protein